MVVCQELSTGCVECFDQSGTASAASTCPNTASYSNGGKLIEINEMKKGFCSVTHTVILSFVQFLDSPIP